MIIHAVTPYSITNMSSVDISVLLLHIQNKLLPSA